MLSIKLNFEMTGVTKNILQKKIFQLWRRLLLVNKYTITILLPTHYPSSRGSGWWWQMEVAHFMTISGEDAHMIYKSAIIVCPAQLLLYYPIFIQKQHLKWQCHCNESTCTSLFHCIIVNGDFNSWIMHQSISFVQQYN